MKLNVHAEQQEVRLSMEIFRFGSVRGDERRRLNRELQAKVDELESVYAAYKLSRARRRNQTEDFGESVKFDGDLLLRLVDDLEQNLKLSQSEVSRGRAYEEYAARRGAKVREEEVGWKGRQRRKELEAMETRFEESWVELKTKGREGSRVENKKGSIDQEDSSTSPRSSPKSSSKNINLDSPTAAPQSLPSFSCLGEENLKPSARSNTATNCTPSQIRNELKDLTLPEFSKEQIFIAEKDGFERQIVKEEAPISHVELDGEEPRPSEESGTCDFSSEKTEVSRHEEEADGELVDASRLNSSLDSEKDSSNREEQNTGETADAARAKKKWVIAEKTTIATRNPSNKLLKDFVKQFKKLIKLGRKGKNTHNDVCVSMSAASAFGGDDDHKGRRRHVLKLSSEHLKKLNDGKIFPRRDQYPSDSFPASPAVAKSMEADQLGRFPKSPCSVLPILPFQGRSEARLNDKLRAPINR